VAYVQPARQRSAVERWPVAGPGARPLPAGPTLELDDDGAIWVGDESVSPTALVAFLAAARREAASDTLRVHLTPAAPADRLRIAMAQARAAGFTRVALTARVPRYPWTLVAYLLDVDAALPVRDADPVQILARVLDVRSPQ
jgi:hypothetical protein